MKRTHLPLAVLVIGLGSAVATDALARGFPEDDPNYLMHSRDKVADADVIDSPYATGGGAAYGVYSTTAAYGVYSPPAAYGAYSPIATVSPRATYDVYRPVAYRSYRPRSAFGVYGPGAAFGAYGGYNYGYPYSPYYSSFYSSVPFFGLDVALGGYDRRVDRYWGPRW